MNIAALFLLAATVQPAQSASQTLFHDPAREVEINYRFTPDGVEFFADLPAGWSFTLVVDSDRNGVWGNGAGLAAATGRPSADRKFGQDGRNGVFCAQLIYASAPTDPDEVMASTDCNGYRSGGRVEMSQLDDRDRATIRYVIPAREVFGEHTDARLQVCVWDTRRSTCHYSPSDPFVLTRPALAASQ